MDAQPPRAGAPAWSYTGQGGPAAWADLDPAYSMCASGREQSPIDLSEAARGAVAQPRFAYARATFHLHDTGHSIEAVAPPGNEVDVAGVAYRLEQFHYHAPSEHRIGSDAFAIELHLVHRAGDGGLLVIGVLVQPGAPNAAVDGLADALTPIGGRHATLADFDPSVLLPDGGRGPRYAYRGSLTTPPCTEGVLWIVFATALQLSDAQIARFTAIHDATNRPLQPRNGRVLLLDDGKRTSRSPAPASDAAPRRSVPGSTTRRRSG